MYDSLHPSPFTLVPQPYIPHIYSSNRQQPHRNNLPAGMPPAPFGGPGSQANIDLGPPTATMETKTPTVATGTMGATGEVGWLPIPGGQALPVQRGVKGAGQRGEQGGGQDGEQGMLPAPQRAHQGASADGHLHQYDTWSDVAKFPPRGVQQGLNAQPGDLVTSSGDHGSLSSSSARSGGSRGSRSGGGLSLDSSFGGSLSPNHGRQLIVTHTVSGGGGVRGAAAAAAGVRGYIASGEQSAAVAALASDHTPLVDPRAAAAAGADALLETFAKLQGEQRFSAVRSIRVLAGRSFEAKDTLRAAIRGVAQYMNDTEVAAGRIEAYPKP